MNILAIFTWYKNLYAVYLDCWLMVPTELQHRTTEITMYYSLWGWELELHLL